ncbi:hypothetical protein I7V28_01230 [Lelliottia amnigena]|uniref:hypothetical protein n=1 Tax=Lelliottia amnigena TaxID=61646 RepID=UPI00192B4E24|nr:hypothetical protein [Lelliottia amnigena]MBL5919756.1 hypothetical protein [Lelliottia amnigena]
MKKIAIVLTGVAFACALSACSAYRSVEKPDGTKKTTVTIAPGTTITGADGGCIDSRGGTCQQPPAQ